MFDSIFGFILMLLGLQTPPMVKGDSTIATASAVTATTSASATAASASAKTKERKAVLVKRMENIVKQKEAFLAAIQTKRETVEAKHAEREDAFLAKIAAFKDDEKTVIIQRVEKNLTTVNMNRTTVMSNHLSTMASILGRMSEKASTTDKDTTGVMNLIAEAETKVTEAMASVTAQTTKTYTITITNGEKNLKADATLARKTLETDLKAAQNKVGVARESIRTAAKELGKLFGETL